tara:strand:- start:188 stop:439 length:252 start_codon:yes stop_codon:yes gene_type:complete
MLLLKDIQRSNVGEVAVVDRFLERIFGPQDFDATNVQALLKTMSDANCAENTSAYRKCVSSLSVDIVEVLEKIEDRWTTKVKK